MIKLFITLYLMVFASFVLFITSGFALGIMSDQLILKSDIEKRLTRGTFNLLDDSATGLNEPQLQTLVEEYQSIFGHNFKLLNLSQVTLDKKHTTALHNGNIVISSHSSHEDDTQHQNIERQENEALSENSRPDNSDNLNSSDNLDSSDSNTNFVYRKLPNKDIAWKIDMDTDTDVSIDETGLSIHTQGGKYANGMFYVIERHLKQSPSNQWSGVMTNLQNRYDLPLKLLSLEDIRTSISNNTDLLEDIRTGVTINPTQGTRHATFVQKIKNHELALQVGPILIPWYIYYMPYLVLLSFALSIATALFLWLWPLWSNLQKIKKAAIEFGHGNYDSRIPYKKRSAISDVSAAFNSMAERTQNSIRSQKELTSAVSHELRTPVTRMRFALEMLENTEDEAERKRYGEDIVDDINDLDKLLEELLSYARFDQANTTLNLQMEMLKPWFDESMNKLLPLSKDKCLTYKVIDIEEKESTLFEPRLLTRVLDNLVQNAIRYAKNKIEVTLTKDNDNYLLIIEDDGNGIEEKERQKVFEAFSRIDPSRHKSTGGFGLGLAISEKIVKAHQGHIEIETSKLGGAKFTASWPEH